MRASEIKFNKLDFFALFPRIHAQTMTSKIISRAWEKTDLLPYNSNVIILQIREILKKRRAKTFSIESFSLLKCTSKSYKKVIDFDYHLLTSNKKINMLSDFKTTLKRHIKRSTANVYSRKIVEIDLNNVQRAQLIKRKRKSWPNIIAVKSNIVIVSMIRAKRQ